MSQHNFSPQYGQILLRVGGASIVTSWILWGAFPQAAFSQYVPLPADPPKEPSIINGSRNRDHLLVFAPQKQIGYFVAGSDIGVAWQVQVDQLPYEMDIRFYNQDQEEIYAYQDSFTQSGVLRKTFPDLSPLLLPNQTYFMEVIMTHNLDSDRKTYESFTAQIEVRDLSPSLETQVMLASSPAERTRLYAEAGYWYSALSEATDQQLLSLITELATLEQLEIPSLLQNCPPN